MAQIPCEASLRPDWLSISFKTHTKRSQQALFDWAQKVSERYCPSGDWNELNSSRYFDRAFQFSNGMRFDSSPQTSSKNAGLSLLTFSGEFWALSSIQQQIRLLDELMHRKDRFHFTRLDVQLTTLNPSQSAEQVVQDVEDERLWIKGFNTYEAKGVKDINGQATKGLSACFGSPSSNRRATSYNKQAEQKVWPQPARRDEVNLLSDWAEAHTVKLATAVAGARSETEAIGAFQRTCSATLAQHMQYLDITGVKKPRPKNWARGRKPPAWWREDLDQVVDPVTVSRKPQTDIEVRFGHMETQWSRTWAEYLCWRVATGKSRNFAQSVVDAGFRLFAHAKEEDVLKYAQDLPEEAQKELLEIFNDSVASAVIHTEHHL